MPWCSTGPRCRSCRSVTTRSYRRTSGRCRWRTCRSGAGSRSPRDRRPPRRSSRRSTTGWSSWPMPRPAWPSGRSTSASSTSRGARPSARRSAGSRRSATGWRTARPRPTGPSCIAREAAWAEVADPSRFAQLAAMAYGFCTQTARDTTYWSLHFHGGYGFMLEYDIQLYYRRCRAWARVLMDSGRAYQRVADRRYGDRPAAGRACTGRRGRCAAMMDFRLGGESDEFRLEVREFLDEHMTPELEERMYRTGVSNDEGFTRALAEQGWLAPGWPVELGGQGRDPVEMLTLHEELRVQRRPDLRHRHDDHGGHRPAGRRHPGAEEDHPEGARRRGHLRARLQRARGRFRCGRGHHPGRARRRRVGHQRPEDVHHERPDWPTTSSC